MNGDPDFLKNKNSTWYPKAANAQKSPSIPEEGPFKIYIENQDDPARQRTHFEDQDNPWVILWVISNTTYKSKYALFDNHPDYFLQL